MKRVGVSDMISSHDGADTTSHISIYHTLNAVNLR